MTNISIVELDGEYMISVIGHAYHRQSENDVDIVCTAISCLTETLGETLKQLHAENLCEDLYTDENQEACRFYAVKEKPGNSAVKQTIKTISIGYQMLAESYPENVSIKISGEGGIFDFPML